MKKILVIDDDVDMVDLMESRLIKSGYQVVFSNDGDAGYKKAIEQKPDLIILDVMMPNMPGGEAVKLLKSAEATKNIPILFFTSIGSYVSKDTDLSEINVDGKTYPAISKPFNPVKLLATVQALIG